MSTSRAPVKPSAFLVHEGWRPAWPGPTTIVWLRWDMAGKRPPLVLADYEASGEPAVHARAAKSKRIDLGLDRVVPYAADMPRLRDWVDVYGRLGIHLSPSPASPDPAIRLQRIQRELARVPRAGERGLMFLQAAGATVAQARQVRLEELGTDAGALVDALSAALSPIPEPDDDVTRHAAFIRDAERLRPTVAQHDRQMDAELEAISNTEDVAVLHGVAI